MRSSDVTSQSAASELQRVVRARGDYAHVSVRARAGHLNVEVTNEQGACWIVARATPLGDGTHGLSFRKHTGTYEPMPVSGTLEEVADGLTTLLGPYLNRANLR